MTARKAVDKEGKRNIRGTRASGGVKDRDAAAPRPEEKTRKRQRTSHMQVLSVYGMMAAGMLFVMTALGILCSWFTIKPSVVTSPNSTYDLIIVGAGTAGCVLAGRLTAANPKLSVLLVEAGGDFGWLASMPVAAPLLQGSSTNDWRYRTVPQQMSSWGLWNRTSLWPRGKGLGGTGQLNFMLHSLGLRDDFELWEKFHGISGWDTNTLQPYIKRMLSVENVELEDTCSPQDTTESEKCGDEKPRYLFQGLTPNENQPKMVIESVDPNKSPIAQAFLNAGKELGIDVGNVENQEYGFFPAISTIAHGQRWSTYTGYLKPEMDKPNLHILLNTHVSKVLFSTSKNVPPTAIAIQLAKENDSEQSQVIYANHEIILSAGAINSAQILLLSGIGPKDHLESMKIPVVADLPVGHNLFDHLNMPVYVSLESPVSITKNKLSSVKAVWDYMINNKGLLASSGVQAVGKAYPGSGIILFGMGTTDEALRDVANFRPDAFEALFPLGHNISQEGMIMLATCLQPLSRGVVQLQHSSPLAHPIIDPNYLTEKEDIACTAEAVRLAVRVAQTKPFQQLGAKVYLPNLPQCQHLPIDIENDDYLECVIRTGGITGYHPGGTCKMGRDDDPSSVVDTDLRVIGVKRLRVMDASVLPTAISGTPNSVLVAMAERASDLITWTNKE